MITAHLACKASLEGNGKKVKYSVIEYLIVGSLCSLLGVRYNTRGRVTPSAVYMEQQINCTIWKMNCAVTIEILSHYLCW